MRILVAGPGKQASKTAELLVKKQVPVECAGLVLENVFKTKYFSATCPVWVDDITSAEEWAEEFASADAAEVREALTLFVYAFEPENPQFVEISKFANLLGEQRCVAVCEDPSLFVNDAEDNGFLCVGFDEIESVVHTALYDAMMDSEEEEEEENLNVVPDLDIDAVLAELKQARESKTMTNEEKKQLVDKLVAQLGF